jgi:nucleotide-binding universal stress UspA family protein/predicted transcriptional regulator
MTRTIIVPIVPPGQDPEHLSLAAIPAARALAERTDAGVVLVTAVAVLPAFDVRTRALVEPAADARVEMLADARSFLAGLATLFPNRRVETIVRWGQPVDAILDVAADTDDPILVAASHARQGLRRLLRGSVAFWLVHEAPCPVLVVRGPHSEGASPLASKLATALVPLDRSRFAEHALNAALAALGGHDLRVHLVHVIDLASVPMMAREEVVCLARPDAERYLRGIAERLVEKGYRVTVEVRIGNPAEQIVQAALGQEAGLIAMATHGLTGLGRRLLGSTAERLLAEATVPLLLVRPDAAAIAAARKLATNEEVTHEEALRASPPSLWDLRADNVMATPAIVAGEETPLVELVATMVTEGIGCLPIVDSEDRLVGIVTESDFVGDDDGVPFAAYQVPQFFRLHLTEEDLERIYAAGRVLTAAQIMSRPVVSVAEDEPVGAVVARMLDRNLKRIPVVRHGTPVGIVTRRDLLKLLIPPPEEASPAVTTA